MEELIENHFQSKILWFHKCWSFSCRLLVWVFFPLHAHTHTHTHIHPAPWLSMNRRNRIWFILRSEPQKELASLCCQSLEVLLSSLSFWCLSPDKYDSGVSVSAVLTAAFLQQSVLEAINSGLIAGPSSKVLGPSSKPLAPQKPATSLII